MYMVQETSIVQGPTCESCRHEWYLAFSNPGLVGPKRRNTRASFGSSKEAMEQQAEEDAALGWPVVEVNSDGDGPPESDPTGNGQGR